MKGYKTLSEIAEQFDVTYQAVRKWVAAGLPYKTEKKIGLKTRRVVRPSDVIKWRKNK